MRLKDKVAVIAGAASGIGKEIGCTFARAGAKVAIADLDETAAQMAAAEINHEGGQAIALAMDVRSEAQVDAGMTRVVDAFGRIDILLSNAGIQIVAVDQLTIGNGYSPFTFYMLGAFEGSLAPQGALCHRQTRPHWLAKVVAKEGAKHGVRANVICPGFWIRAGGPCAIGQGLSCVRANATRWSSANTIACFPKHWRPDSTPSGTVRPMSLKRAARS